MSSMHHITYNTARKYLVITTNHSTPHGPSNVRKYHLFNVFTSFNIKSELKDKVCWLSLQVMLLAFFPVSKYSIEIPCKLHLKHLQV
jgi:hypothetical protein